MSVPGTGCRALAAGLAVSGLALGGGDSRLPARAERQGFAASSEIGGPAGPNAGTIGTGKAGS